MDDKSGDDDRDGLTSWSHKVTNYENISYEKTIALSQFPELTYKTRNDYHSCMTQHYALPDTIHCTLNDLTVAWLTFTFPAAFYTGRNLEVYWLWCCYDIILLVRQQEGYPARAPTPKGLLQRIWHKLEYM